MKKLSVWLKEFFLCFPYVKIIIFLAVTYGLFAAVEVLSYYSLFRWNETLIGEAPRNYFAVITVASAYGAFIIVPQAIGEVYRYRKLKLMLERKIIPYKAIIKSYSVGFPRYNEFKIFDKASSERNAISFMTVWIYVGGFLFAFFVLLRVSEVDDIIAVPALAITAIMWGIALSIFIRLINNLILRKVFWGKVNLANLVKEDTALMEAAEIASDKKTAFILRVFVGAEMLIMVFIMLALYFVISFAALMIATGCTIALALTLIIVTSVKKYRKDTEDTKIAYKF